MDATWASEHYDEGPGYYEEETGYSESWDEVYSFNGYELEIVDDELDYGWEFLDDLSDKMDFFAEIFDCLENYSS